MPRKIPQETLNRWRQLDAEGVSYKQIGRETKWDPRTVAKHLRAEIRFSEPDDIRRELFKEGLRDHWGLLVRETVASLKLTQPLEPWTNLVELSRPAPLDFPIGGATVTVEANGKALVQAFARKNRSCELLAQHISTDSLWRTLAAWEKAVAADVGARRRLYDDAVRMVTGASGWPLVPEATDSEAPALLAGAPQLTFDMAFARALGLTNRDRRPDAYTISYDGVVECSPYRLARPPKGTGRQEVYEIVEHVTKELTRTKSATDAVNAYKQAQTPVKELHRILDDLRLLVYLPGVCDVCSRFSAGLRPRNGAH